ncbi:polyribonucleotide nucleotidyltransferase [Lactococcus lactis subsp. lactis]|uniref:polyribonucleotide nucleotidyltransferase n=1 Tax=Lactococcus lactis TaxID=1358 RepID=UPI000559AE75|nr:polyribonucleotide nucleotidyltransferase [Lactococcus lactis]AJA57709.1 polynucleotide phosphorylase [Lactococcus lactis subsp. lactis]KWT47560.1 polynucleotide phosphorylase [Lactococcus lactis]WBM77055.1 polyribonucleotide nucleotidyltransferase [Lactococcus lactis]WSP31518.1 polyribonucleotide nucleotidyltransferase [Lactococcus lactis subsp. lactis]
MAKETFSIEFAGRTLTVETGQVAKQANGAVVVRYGDTTVLTAATMGKMATGDFFPLQVNYEEKMYAAGKFPGGFNKREARPSTDATLTARLIDRPIRPMFAEGFRNEVQVINTVLSYDENASGRVAAMFGSSLALAISDIPFDGPIAGVEVAYIDGEYIINPTVAEKEASSLELSVAGNINAINMVESGAKELSEEVMLGALLAGHNAVKELIEFQNEIVAKVGKEKAEVELLHVDEDLKAEVIAAYNSDLQKAVQIEEKLARESATKAVKEAIISVYSAKYENDENLSIILRDLAEILEGMEHAEVRRLITEDKIRPDGRKIDEIRPLDAEIDFTPRNITHGTGLFTRGQTQALSTLTLAPMNEAQIIDGLNDEYKKRFMHHYNFPQYSVGETGRYGAPGRREIGHGALGERALEQVLPSLEEFPYAIRLVAEVLESNGSSSQASICAGTLALMAGGVPIKAPVAGIAMGLISDGTNYTVLTDIQGLEDHFGDMDFKVAGTRDGITALQMDIKISGITPEILAEALAQAKTARFQILDVIEATIAQPREELAPSAPKIDTITIPVDKIKVVIGKGGEQIDKIIAETGVKIDIDDEGLCSIFSSDQAVIDRAKEIIAELVREAKVGEIYDAKVVRIESFGAFVNLFGKQDAMVHISEMAWARTENVEDVVKLGDTVKVKIMKIDDKGRVDASMRALVEKPEGYVEPERKPRERRENGDRRKGNGNSNRGNGFDRRNNDRNNQGNKVGNHSFELRERKSHIDEEFPELSTKKPE